MYNRNTKYHHHLDLFVVTCSSKLRECLGSNHSRKNILLSGWPGVRIMCLCRLACYHVNSLAQCVGLVQNSLHIHNLSFTSSLLDMQVQNIVYFTGLLTPIHPSIYYIVDTF